MESFLEETLKKCGFSRGVAEENSRESGEILERISELDYARFFQRIHGKKWEGILGRVS